MELYFFNTKTRKKELFQPQQPPRVGLYVCGPTVYDYAHIGNLRAYVFSDILRRVLEYNNFQVHQVMNITDVGHLVSDADEGEDKMLVGARRQKKSPFEIADYFTEAFFNHTQRLNIKDPTIACRATDHIQEMIDFVQVLLDRGYAYEISDGIYFDISRFPHYGKLSRLNLEEQLEGARVEVNPEKKHPADFALWRKAPANHIMQWPSPWGMGYPGWHIECSAMGLKYLEGFFDIHTGGVDHIPIHHENEIAQNWGFTGKEVVRFWMHSEFLQVEGGKMAKSLGNIYTLEDLEEKGFDPLAFRYLLLNAHYRKKVNFTWEALEGAQRALERLRENFLRFKEASPGRGNQKGPEQFRTEIERAFNDDLNVPRALALTWDILRGEDPTLEYYKLLLEVDRVLGLGLEQVERPPVEEIPGEIKKLIEQREEARKKRNWEEADAIRDHLEEQGIRLIDTPQGVRWERIKKKGS